MSLDVASELVLDSRIDEIRKLGPWLEAAIPEAGFAAARAEIEMALVELVSNIIRHGYGNRAGASIDLEFKRTSDLVQIVIHDSGEPVPPWARDFAEKALDFDPFDLEALPSGGIGLAMAIAAMDHFDYKQGNGANVTRIEKAIHAAD